MSQLLQIFGEPARRGRKGRWWRWFSLAAAVLALGGLTAWSPGALAGVNQPGSGKLKDVPDGRIPLWPMPEWSAAAPEDVGLDPNRLAEARDYALTGQGAGFITRHGRLVMAWGNPRERYDLKSTTKSIGSIALGVAIDDGKVRLTDRATLFHPGLGTPPESNAGTGWIEEITVLHLASQTAGFEKPGGYTPLLFEPGSKWDYSDAGPNWLAECLTLVYRRDLRDWMFERVFSPLGITPADLTWRRHAYRPAELEGIPRREFGSGILANVDALARIGYLMLREGRWQDRQILSPAYVQLARRTPSGHAQLPVLHPETYGAGASAHYGLLWWNNQDGTLAAVPRDAYWSWGLHDSLIVVIPSLDMVISRAGRSWKREDGAAHYDVLQPFLVPIVEAVKVSPAQVESEAPYGQSPVIGRLDWAPRESIIRRARGSDNWPMTWGDDDLLYTAYGDGWGFEPRLEEKLSLGLARVRGVPPDCVGENLRAPSLEQRGDGARGRKASGLLMVDGVLYLWARNAGNAKLAWSDDHGAAWTWADWALTTSFGCPTFLNFGPDYAGARDRYVYIYSHDGESAYHAGDRMVLARVPNDQLRDRAAYEFFERLDAAGEPVWTTAIESRGAVFTHRARCYRSGITYNAGLRRYLWVQVYPESRHPQGPRFQGGFGIYDAPEPWGPWSTVFHTDDWDVGPGESACLPAKWMSPDGKQVCLVFSGDDSFSVRRCCLATREQN